MLITDKKEEIKNKSSLIFWYTKIKDLPIPQPKTEIYVIPENVLAKLRDENMGNLDMNEVRKVARKIGYPLFARTDLASGKHAWKKSCYVENEESLERNLFEVISHNLIADIFGLPFTALVFREYIEMDSRFEAFYGEMPVNPERRYFIKGEKVICHHPYWTEDAIEEGNSSCWDKLPKNWKEILKEINTETEKEVKLLTKYAEIIARAFEGYWSIDFCKARDGRWILIDMAEGHKSWHAECPNKLSKIREGA